MKFKKLKAGALQLTIFIVVVIGLLLSAFIILMHTHKRFNIQSGFVIETVKNTDKGINYILQNEIQKYDTISINLKDEGYKTLKVHRDYWGLFEKVTVISKIKSYEVKKVALVGVKQEIENRTALYLKENNRPLVLVGNTKIQGVVYLPKRGVKTGNISGESYNGDRLIYGQKGLSTNFPKLLSETLETVKEINDVVVQNSNQFLDISSTNKIHKNSFLKPLKIIFSTIDINLSNIALTGHIIVQSKTKISIEASSHLKDVILIAPKIEIKNDVKGTFQAFATETITVGTNCKLNYPSVLVLNEQKSTIKNNSSQDLEHIIQINEGSILKGAVVFLGLPNANNYMPQIIINPNVIIKGEVYCNQNLELKGTVFGSVFTNSFVANVSGSIYQNHLYNAKILIDDLESEYVGLPLKNSKKGVLKWLY